MTSLIVRRRVNPWMEMDQLWEELYQRGNGPWGAIQVKEKEEGYLLTAELPGFNAKDLDIQVKGNLLTIKIRKKEEENSSYEKSFVLPPHVEGGKVEAQMKDGLLTLEIPYREESAPTNISIKA